MGGIVKLQAEGKSLQKKGVNPRNLQQDPRSTDP